MLPDTGHAGDKYSIMLDTLSCIIMNNACFEQGRYGSLAGNEGGMWINIKKNENA